MVPRSSAPLAFSFRPIGVPDHEPRLQAAVRAGMGSRAAGWRHGLLLALLALNTAFGAAGEWMVGVGARPGVSRSLARRRVGSSRKLWPRLAP